MDKLRIGSRESALAVAQTQIIIDGMHGGKPSLSCELITMKTEGDRILHRTLEEIGGKGLFVKELDQAILDGTIDLAVHSLKDLPMELTPGLSVLAYSKRADARDALVLPRGVQELDNAKPIGSSSARRRIQLKTLHPQCTTAPVRGNVLTRLKKLDSGEYSALVLACAGLSRLGLENRISRIFTEEEMVPAAGQGILAVVGRTGEAYDCLSSLDDFASRCCAQAERAFVRALGGGCTEPIAAFGRVHNRELSLWGFYSDGEISHRRRITGSVDQALSLGERLAQEMRGCFETR